MEQTEKKQTLARRTRRQMLQLISEYEKSQGITIKAFCQQHGISEGSFYGFRNRYKGKDQPDKRTGGFISIATPASRELSHALFAEVNGIKIYQAVSADYLKALVL